MSYQDELNTKQTEKERLEASYNELLRKKQTLIGENDFKPYFDETSESIRQANSSQLEQEVHAAKTQANSILGRLSDFFIGLFGLKAKTYGEIAQEKESQLNAVKEFESVQTLQKQMTENRTQLKYIDHEITQITQQLQTEIKPENKVPEALKEETKEATKPIKNTARSFKTEPNKGQTQLQSSQLIQELMKKQQTNISESKSASNQETVDKSSTTPSNTDQIKKQKAETTRQLRVLDMKREGCKFIHTNNENELKELMMENPDLKDYQGTVIALIDKMLYEASKKVGRSGLTVRIKEISPLETDEHQSAMNQLSDKLKTFEVNTIHEAADNLDLAITVITGKTSTSNKEAIQGVGEETMGAGMKALAEVGQDNIKQLKGALIFCKSQALINTALSLTDLESGSDNQSELKKTLDGLYPQLKTQLQNEDLNPRQKEAIKKLHDLLPVVFPSIQIDHTISTESSSQQQKESASPPKQPPRAAFLGDISSGKQLKSAKTKEDQENIQPNQPENKRTQASKDLLSAIRATKKDNDDTAPKLGN